MNNSPLQQLAIPNILHSNFSFKRALDKCNFVVVLVLKQKILKLNTEREQSITGM